jgi:hypothetical protein
MRVRYLYDAERHRAENAAGRCHWAAYTPLMLEVVGLTAQAVSPAEVAGGGWEAETAVLLLTGPMGAGAERVERWVEGGGILVAWAQHGEPAGGRLDVLFGVRPVGIGLRQEGDFAVGGLIELDGHPLTEGVASPLAPGEPLLLFSDARALGVAGAEEVARLRSLEGNDAGGAAITARRVGRGWAFCFGFDLAKTVRVLHHGKPVERDEDGDGLLRMSEAVVIGEHSPRVPYADALLFLLRNMMARRSLPLVSPLPPLDGRPADVLFHYGGDDECTPGMAVSASRWMREKGLPYHSNLMPVHGRFAVSPEEAKEMVEVGHEISLHFNFVHGFVSGAGFTEADVQEQVRQFQEAYGCRPICTVNHCCRWWGWVEPARWMAAAGVRADNSRIHRRSPPLNPVNEIGFGFGTGFPYWCCDDASGGDRRLEFLCVPITGYEIGYRSEISGTAPPEDPDQQDLEQVERALEIAAHYHLTMNMFYHPVYIARSPACRAAIEALLAGIERRGLRAVHMGSDAVVEWWSARSRSGIEEWELEGELLRFRTRCARPGGMVVQVPVGAERLNTERGSRALAAERTAAGAGPRGRHGESLEEVGGVARRVRVDGSEVSAELRWEFGQGWVWVVVPEGEHWVEVGV